MKRVSFYIAIFLSVICIISCSKNDSPQVKKGQNNLGFNSNSLIIKEESHTKQVRGQLLYLPIYSNVPYHKSDKKFDLSAFVAIHNTDLSNTIRLTKVMFFDNDGKLVENYLAKDTLIHPMGAITFFIPERDQSGTGANFLVEWVSDTPVNEPLIESVMLGLSRGQGVSFSSAGKVIREVE